MTNKNIKKSFRSLYKVGLILALVPAIYACAPVTGSNANNYNRNVANLNDEVVGLKQSVTELQIEVEQQRQFVDQLSNSQSIQDDLLVNLNQRNESIQRDTNNVDAAYVAPVPTTTAAPTNDTLNNNDAFDANTVALEPLQDGEEDEIVSNIVVTPANSGFGPSSQPILIATEPQVSALVAADTASVSQPILIVAEGELSRKDLYNRGYNEYAQQNYAMAINTFNAYISRYNDDLSDNAQYWIGESYYAEENYDRAYTAFEKVGKMYPDSNKIADSLYKMAIIRNKEGDTAAAKSIAEKLVQLYPATAAANYARQNIL